MITRLIIELSDIYTFIIFVYILLSWFPNKRGIVAEIDSVLAKICDPFLNIFRRLIPPIGGTIDISPIIAILVLQVAVRLICSAINFLI